MEGETIHLRVLGEQAVHLTGYYIDDAQGGDPYGGYDSEELDAELNGEDIEESEQDECDEDEDEEDDDDVDSDMADFIDDDSLSEDEEMERPSKRRLHAHPRIEMVASDGEEGCCDHEEEDSEDYDSEEYDSEEDDDEMAYDSEEDGDEMVYDSEDDDIESEDEEIDSDEAGSVDLSKGRKIMPEEVTMLKKIKVESPQSKSENKMVDSPNKKADIPNENINVAIKKVDAPNQKTDMPQKQTSSKVPQQQLPCAPVSKTLQGGIKVDDIKVGTGIKAQKSRRVEITYTIASEDGEIVDGSASKSLSFNLGDANVPKAFGIGINGMALGGERKLTIPPKMIEKEGVQPSLPRSGNCIVSIKLEKVHPTIKANVKANGNN